MFSKSVKCLKCSQDIFKPINVMYICQKSCCQSSSVIQPDCSLPFTVKLPLKLLSKMPEKSHYWPFTIVTVFPFRARLAYCRSNLTQDLFVVPVPAFFFLFFLSFFFLHSHLHTANGGWSCLCCTKLSPFVASLQPLNGSLCCLLIKRLQTVILATYMHARRRSRQMARGPRCQ